MKIYGINNVNYTNYGINKNLNKKNNQSFGSLIIEDLNYEDFYYVGQILSKDKALKQYVDMADKEGFDYVIGVDCNNNTKFYIQNKSKDFKTQLFRVRSYYIESDTVNRGSLMYPNHVKQSDLAQEAIDICKKLKKFNTNEVKEI